MAEQRKLEQANRIIIDLQARNTALEAELTQARAERDKARRALGKALDGWYDATILLLQTGVSHEDVTVRNRNKCNEARAAIKAAERNDEENGTKH